MFVFHAWSLAHPTGQDRSDLEGCGKCFVHCHRSVCGGERSIERRKHSAEVQKARPRGAGPRPTVHRGGCGSRTRPASAQAQSRRGSWARPASAQASEGWCRNCRAKHRQLQRQWKRPWRWLH